MVSLIEVLEKIEAANLGNHRLTTIHVNDSPELREVLNYTLSPDITFGLKKLPSPAGGIGGSINSLCSYWWPTFKVLLDKLASRQLSGNAAKQEVSEFLRRCTSDSRELKWAQRILLQDLRLSVGAKDINKILGEEVIRVFKLPLAAPFKALKSTAGKWALQPKFDGGRCVASVTTSTVKLQSRTGKEWGPAFNGIREQLGILRERMTIDCPDLDLILDGELVVYKHGRMDFQATQRLFHVKTERVPEGVLQYALFDACASDEWSESKTSYVDRYDTLKNIFITYAYDLDMLKLSPIDLVEDPTEDELHNKAGLMVRDLGCDGLIMRRADRPVSLKRSTDIVKVKNFEDGEALVVGKIPGTGHLEGSLGALECELDNGVRFELGTGEGFTKELRQELWDDEHTIGSWVSLKWLRLSEDGIPINPTYRAIRHQHDF